MSLEGFWDAKEHLRGDAGHCALIKSVSLFCAMKNWEKLRGIAFQRLSFQDVVASVRR